MTAPYRVQVLDAAGTSYGYTDVPVISSVTWTLNEPATISFTMPTVHADTALMIPTQREIKLIYNDGVSDKTVFAGPIVKRACNGQDTQVDAASHLWYLDKIMLGPILTELLTDPNFEDATLAAYTAVGATMSSETTLQRQGSRCLKLVNTNPDEDHYAKQTFTVTAGAIDLEIFLRARAYFVNTGGTPWTGYGFQERLLYMKRMVSGVDQVEADGVVGRWMAGDSSLPLNEWFKVVCWPISVPAGATQTIEVRFYSCGGTVLWDTARCTVEESTGGNTAPALAPADINTIVGNVLTYGQNTAKDKTNFHIGNPAGTFGVSLSRQYQFYDHGFLWGACIEPFIKAGYMDVDIDPDSRVLQTYVKLGTDRTAKVLTLGLAAASGSLIPADVASYPQDGGATAGAIVQLPQGMAAENTLQPNLGPTASLRAVDDVAYEVDTSANGGVTFTELFSGVPEDTIDALTAQAKVELARKKNLYGGPQFVCPADVVIAAGIKVGDTVTFNGTFGWVSDDHVTRRVVTMTLDPVRNLMYVTGQLP